LAQLTFFQANRWFLQLGLLASGLLPFGYWTKVVWIPAAAVAEQAVSQAPEVDVVKAAPLFDWSAMGLWIYGAISLLLLLQMLLRLLSFFRFVRRHQVRWEAGYGYVETDEPVLPYSFLRYIVYNPNRHTAPELKAILQHERVHGQQWHSVDVLLSHLYICICWANPFAWAYRKAISQNLEYIADRSAIAHGCDLHGYQQALVQQVNPEQLQPLAHSFYQSFIKKRILMLHVSQTNKRQSWRYAVVLPFLAGFFLLFQTRVVAQVAADSSVTTHTKKEIRVVIRKDDSDAQIQSDFDQLKQNFGIVLKFSKLKRNDMGEITRIKIKFEDKNGSGEYYADDDKPIVPICFHKQMDEQGNGMVGIGPLSAQDQDSDVTGKRKKICAADVKVKVLVDSIQTDKIKKGIADDEPIIIVRKGKVLDLLDDKTYSFSFNDDDLKGIGEKIKVQVDKLSKGDQLEDLDAVIEKALNAAFKGLEAADMVAPDAPDPADAPTAPTAPEVRKAIKKAMRQAKKAMSKAQFNKTEIQRDMEEARKDRAEAQKEMEEARREMQEARAEMEALRKEMQALQQKLKAKPAKKQV